MSNNGYSPLTGHRPWLFGGLNLIPIALSWLEFGYYCWKYTDKIFIRVKQLNPELKLLAEYRFSTKSFVVKILELTTDSLNDLYKKKLLNSNESKKFTKDFCDWFNGFIIWFKNADLILANDTELSGIKQDISLHFRESTLTLNETKQKFNDSVNKCDIEIKLIRKSKYGIVSKYLK